MGDFYNNYQQPQFGFQSRRACGPCQPQFKEMGYVAYTPLPGSRGLEDQLQGAVGFWQSLADPALGECVNAFGQTGRQVRANYPQFGCGGSGQQGGGYVGGGHVVGGHPNAGHANAGHANAGHANAGYYYDSPPDEAYYGSPYVQPFANQQARIKNPDIYAMPPKAFYETYDMGYKSGYHDGYQNGAEDTLTAVALSKQNHGYSAPYTRGTETPEQLEDRLRMEERKEAIYESYAAKREAKEKAKREAAGHGGGHGSGKHLSDADVLAEAMKTSEGFKGFLRSRLEKKSGWFSEGDVDTDGLARLATEYFSENPEELRGRHLSATEVESACFRYIETNKDNKFNWDGSRTAAAAIAGGAGAAALLTSGGWALLPGLISGGSIVSMFDMKDDFKLNKGDMKNIH